uniref:Conserved oligomeric Golgi complex subunit 1 n=1 Tax=Ditylenchus dipsaci TaxID=166011 RepID=A0A915EJ09_9BILA
MNRDAEKIVRCNKTLHQATEQALCHYIDFVIEDCVENSQLAQIPRLCTSFNLWLDLVQVNEKTNLEDGNDVSSGVDVPTQLSRHYFHFLYTVCQQINNHSIGHLFTRNVIADVSRRLGELLSSNLKQCAQACSSAPLICTQLLFDCRALFLMFPVNKGFIEAAEMLQAKIDPFELKLVSTPISKNAKLFAQRTTMVFGQLQVEHVSGNSKDSNNLNASYSALVDITPKIADVRRLTLIPGCPYLGAMMKNECKKENLLLLKTFPQLIVRQLKSAWLARQLLQHHPFLHFCMIRSQLDGLKTNMCIRCNISQM